MKEQKIQLTVRLTPDVYNRLKKLAKDGKTINRVAGYIIGYTLERADARREIAATK